MLQQEQTQNDPNGVPEGAMAWMEHTVGKCSVAVEDPQKMNLLGLLLANVVERALENPKTQRKCGPMKGDVQVKAGRMSVRLRFNQGRVEVVRASDAGARASVRGDLETLTDVSLGGGVVRHFLSRRLRVAGNVLFLLKTLPFLRIP